MTRHHQDARGAAVVIIEKLRDSGHVALLAGGCVRDGLLKRVPKDYDVATDATPTRVQELFPKARKVGAKFGVMLVRRRGQDVEVATFRSDGPYSDGRHPDHVEFGTEYEDARRRDFTINGLFLDPVDGRVFDHVNGCADIEAGIIRTIGDPDERFGEDHLRLLRAIRFAARLDFTIESATLAAMSRLAPYLRTVSAERVWMELEMILTDPNRATAWSLLVETGLHAHLSDAWPVLDDSTDAIRGRLAALSHKVVEPELALAVLLRDHSPMIAAKACRGLRVSNRLCDAVVWMLSGLAELLDEASLELADLKLLMAVDSWPLLLELLRVDQICTGADSQLVARVEDRAAAIPKERISPPPLLTGDDLRDMGVTPGPRLGDIHRELYRTQLNEQIISREQAVAMAERLIKSPTP